MRAVEKPYDLVVTTNSGFPLDMNLYQAVKGMSAAARIVREGGAILIAAECSDGVPTPRELSRAFEQRKLAPGMARHYLPIARAHPRSMAGTDPGQDSATSQRVPLFEPSGARCASRPTPAGERYCRVCPRSPRNARARTSEPHRIAVLPEGPQTVPYLK
jgi:hypothetical protein